MATKTWLWVVGGIVLVAGFASAIVMMRPDTSDPASERASSRSTKTKPARAGSRMEAEGAPVFDTEAPLEDRVAALEAEVGRLRSEVSTLRFRARVDGGGGGGGTVTADGSDPIAIRDQVSELLEEERLAEQERRAERWQERNQERIDQALADLTQRAGLRPDQRDAIAKAWLEEGQKVGTLMAEARAEDGNFRDVREKVDELRSKTDEALASTLDDDQLNEYEAVRAEMNRRGRGDRGGQPSQ